MLNQVKGFIKNQKLFGPGDKIVVAVSGGPDSMALLHIMQELKSSWDLTLIAAHLHHGLRSQADEDLDLLREQCRAWGITLEVKHLDIASLAREDKRSLEEMGRICRYDFFAEVLQRHQAQYIATAHHQEDNAESVLLHLLRGSGIQGLRGILPINNNIVRPMLGISKAQIMEYISKNQIPYGVDYSNNDLRFTRNRIRHELIPCLRGKYNPQLINTLNQLADIVRQEDDWLQDLTVGCWQEIVTEGPDRLVIAIQPFSAAHPAAQRRLVMAVCRRLTGLEGWEKKDIDSIIRLGQSPGSSHYLRLRKGLMVYKVYDQLVFTTRQRKKVAFNYPLTVPGQVYIEETGELVSCFVLPREKCGPQSRDTLLDWDRVKGALFLRSRLPGDRFAVSPTSTSTKLKEYFIKNKIPWADRERIPILASDLGRIYALVGQAVDNDAWVTSQTEYILVIKRERLNKTDQV
jgi:tRNA(Ile)-lysidine synthase